MENASKALLIAGAMLLTILLATLAIYIFNTFGGQTAGLYDKLEQSDIDSFNQKFLQYEDKELRIQDVVSIINLAKDNNNSNRLPVKVKVMEDENDLVNATIDENYIKSRIDDIYTCKTEIPSGSQLIEKVIIQKK